MLYRVWVEGTEGGSKAAASRPPQQFLTDFLSFSTAVGRAESGVNISHNPERGRGRDMLLIISGRRAPGLNADNVVIQARSSSFLVEFGWELARSCAVEVDSGFLLSASRFCRVNVWVYYARELGRDTETQGKSDCLSIHAIGFKRVC
jgi:hypothetical protein